MSKTTQKQHPAAGTCQSAILKSTMLGKYLLRPCTLALLSIAASAPAHSQTFVDVKPTQAQVEWQDLEIGAIIHYSTNTFLNPEGGAGTADPHTCTPSHADADQGMQLA